MGIPLARLLLLAALIAELLTIWLGILLIGQGAGLWIVLIVFLFLAQFVNIVLACVVNTLLFALLDRVRAPVSALYCFSYKVLPHVQR